MTFRKLLVLAGLLSALSGHGMYVTERPCHEDEVIVVQEVDGDFRPTTRRGVCVPVDDLTTDA